MTNVHLGFFSGRQEVVRPNGFVQRLFGFGWVVAVHVRVDSTAATIGPKFVATFRVHLNRFDVSACALASKYACDFAFAFDYGCGHDFRLAVPFAFAVLVAKDLVVAIPV